MARPEALALTASAIVSRISHGVRQDTENQFERRNLLTTWGMGFLIVGELGGVFVLVWGFLASEVL